MTDIELQLYAEKEAAKQGYADPIKFWGCVEGIKIGYTQGLKSGFTRRELEIINDSVTEVFDPYDAEAAVLISKLVTLCT